MQKYPARMPFHHRFHELQKLITLRTLCRISLRPSNGMISFYMILVIALTLTSGYIIYGLFESEPDPMRIEGVVWTGLKSLDLASGLHGQDLRLSSNFLQNCTIVDMYTLLCLYRYIFVTRSFETLIDLRISPTVNCKPY